MTQIIGNDADPLRKKDAGSEPEQTPVIHGSSYGFTLGDLDSVAEYTGAEKDSSDKHRKKFSWYVGIAIGVLAHVALLALVLNILDPNGTMRRLSDILSERIMLERTGHVSSAPRPTPRPTQTPRIQPVKNEPSYLTQRENSNYNSLAEDNVYLDEVSEGHLRDVRTGLVWRRCPLGMEVYGMACKGRPLAVSLNNYNAIKIAGYRLPTIQELSSLMSDNCGRLRFELVDNTYFRKRDNVAQNGACTDMRRGNMLPYTMQVVEGVLLSGTPYPTDPSLVWGISTYDGGAAVYDLKQQRAVVLLVMQ